MPVKWLEMTITPHVTSFNKIFQLTEGPCPLQFDIAHIPPQLVPRSVQPMLFPNHPKQSTWLPIFVYILPKIPTRHTKIRLEMKENMERKSGHGFQVSVTFKEPTLGEDHFLKIWNQDEKSTNSRTLVQLQTSALFHVVQGRRKPKLL